MAHKQPVKDKWSASDKKQQKKLIIALQELIDRLENEDQVKVQLTAEKASDKKDIYKKKELAETL